MKNPCPGSRPPLYESTPSRPGRKFLHSGWQRTTSGDETRPRPFRMMTCESRPTPCAAPFNHSSNVPFRGRFCIPRRTSPEVSRFALDVDIHWTYNGRPMHGEASTRQTQNAPPGSRALGAVQCSGQARRSRLLGMDSVPAAPSGQSRAERKGGSGGGLHCRRDTNGKAVEVRSYCCALGRHGRMSSLQNLSIGGGSRHALPMGPPRLR